MTPAARLAASIELLSAIEAATRKPADAVANAFFRDRRYIGSGDRRAVGERTWRVLRARRRLGWWLQRGRAAYETPRLLVGASLLTDGWTLDGVAQSFSGGQFGSPHLDAAERAVLGGVAGHTLDHPAMPEAVRLEVPDWLVPHLERRFGAAIVAEMAAVAEAAPLDLRVNVLLGTREAAIAALAAEGVEAEPTPHSPWGLRVPARQPITGGAAFKAGLVEIQDEGSQLVAALVGAAPDMRVADWCAGAGGKTLALAMTMANHGHIVACDVSAHRLDGAVKRLRRAGVHNVERHLIEPGDKWAKRREGQFDRVLVDAPCTGTGTWRRNPDARLRLRPIDLQELVVKQAMILDQAQRVVRPGGRLVYATCSLLREENEDQIESFLERHAGKFAVVPLERAWVWGGGPPASADPAGMCLSLTPRGAGTDGFFAAVLERGRLIAIRPARDGDAMAIAAVHVAAWRSAYPTILPARFLAGMSVNRQAAYYGHAIGNGACVQVASVVDEPGPRVVGFATAGLARAGAPAEGEIETLYVLDDWRDRGVGRLLLRACALWLSGQGARSAYLWVLRDNPSRWFYTRLGGRRAADAMTRVAGHDVAQSAFVWEPIERLLIPADHDQRKDETGHE